MKGRYTKRSKHMMLKYVTTFHPNKLSIVKQNSSIYGLITGSFKRSLNRDKELCDYPILIGLQHFNCFYE